MTQTEKNKVANEFGVGYTYLEFKDDSGALLSSLQIYTLPGEFKTYSKQLIESISTNIDSKDFLVVPLMDYMENPHSWMRSLRSWLLTFQEIYPIENEEVLLEEYRSKHKNYEDGVYSYPLGINILLLVVNTETRPDWEHSIFEYIQYVLRIISLKHGCSILYTSLLRTDTRIIQLISNLLGIEISHKAMSKLEPNLVDHTEILVPVGFDSWGKIKTLSDDIDPSQLSEGWNLKADNNLIESYEKIVPDLEKSTSTEVKENLEDRVIEEQSFQEFLSIQYQKEHRSQEKILRSFIQNVQSRTDELDK